VIVWETGDKFRKLSEWQSRADAALRIEEFLTTGIQCPFDFLYPKTRQRTAEAGLRAALGEIEYEKSPERMRRHFEVEKTRMRGERSR
jgi:hypothetical protein